MTKNILATTFSLEGLVLSDREKHLFEKASPCGFILFKRNIENPEQLRALTKSLKEIVEWDCPILIDQEGGRVQRMREPSWTNYPAAATYNDDQNALAADMEGLAQELIDMGFNVDCAPVLDMRTSQTHDAIGDRAYSGDVGVIVRSAKTVIDTFLEKGLTPVIKHLPGQGRAACDSHEDLPYIDTPCDILSKTDFIPCQEISKEYGDKIWGMVAHICYKDIDPDLPSTLSHKLLKDIVRDEIGFKGFLLTDDIDMGALKQYGSVVDRSKMALEAGCDCVLYCSGVYEDMENLVQGLPSLTDEAVERLKRSNRWTKQES